MKHICTLLLISFLLVYLTSCTATQPSEPAVELTSTPLVEELQPTASSTPTRQPFQPEDKIWQAPPVIAMLFERAGYTAEDYAYSQIPRLVIYADGTVIFTEYNYRSDTRDVFQASIASAELCNVLYHIEATGFLTFPQSAYEEPEITDAGTTHMVVNAWETNHISAYALGFSWGDEPQGPTNLLETQRLLSELKPANTVPYEAKELLIDMFRYPLEPDQSAAPTWPLESPSLADIFDKHGEGYEAAFVLSGTDAQAIATQMGNKYATVYKENGSLYSLITRPVLPYQPAAAQSFGWSPLPVFSEQPQVELRCQATDYVPITHTAVEPTPTATLTADSPSPFPFSFNDQRIGSRNRDAQISYASTAMLTDNGTYLVIDQGNYRLLEYSAEGHYLSETQLSEPGNWAEYVWFLPNGTMLVYDWIANLITIRSLDGNVLEAVQGWPKAEDWRDDGDNMTNVALTPDGILYGAQTRGHQVVALNLSGEVVETWSGPESSPFNDILDLATDLAGNLYIAMDDPKRIVKRGVDGSIDTFTTFVMPLSIAVMPDQSFFVTDSDIFVHYDAEGNGLNSWEDEALSRHGSGELEAVTDGTLLYIEGTLSNEKDNLVHHYHPDGTKILSFASSKLQGGQFDRHLAFATSYDDDIWVVHTGSRYGDNPDNQTFLAHLTQTGDHLNTFTQIGNEPLDCNVYELAAPQDGTLLLANPCRGQLFHIAADGSLLASWGEIGTADNQFNLITAVELTPDEQSVLILDNGSARLSQYSLSGEPQAVWSTADWGAPQPVDLAIAPNGDFFILEENQIVVATSDGSIRAWPLDLTNELAQSILVSPTNNLVFVSTNTESRYSYNQQGTQLGSWIRTEYRRRLMDFGGSGTYFSSYGERDILIYDPVD